MTIQAFVLYLVLTYVVIGAIGSAIEKAGIELKSPRAIAIGKAIEAVAADGFKLKKNILAAFSGKDPE